MASYRVFHFVANIYVYGHEYHTVTATLTYCKINEGPDMKNHDLGLMIDCRLTYIHAYSEAFMEFGSSAVNSAVVSCIRSC